MTAAPRSRFPPENGFAGVVAPFNIRLTPLYDPKPPRPRCPHPAALESETSPQGSWSDGRCCQRSSCSRRRIWWDTYAFDLQNVIGPQTEFVRHEARAESGEFDPSSVLHPTPPVVVGTYAFDLQNIIGTQTQMIRHEATEYQRKVAEARARAYVAASFVPRPARLPRNRAKRPIGQSGHPHKREKDGVANHCCRQRRNFPAISPWKRRRDKNSRAGHDPRDGLGHTVGNSRQQLASTM